MAFSFYYINCFTKSAKFKALLPWRGYCLKKGTIIFSMSENFETIKFTISFSSFILPQPKYSIKLFIKLVSLLCWVIWKTKFGNTFVPLFLIIPIQKLPSPSMNPLKKWGFKSLGSTLSLNTGIASGKSALIVSVNLYSSKL